MPADDYKYPNSVKSLNVVTDKPAHPHLHAAPDTVPAPVAKPQAAEHPATSIQKKLLEGKIIEAVRTVYDPEIPVNIHDLGLIYEINISDDNKVLIKMTLT